MRWTSAAARRLTNVTSTHDVVEAVRAVTANLLRDVGCPPTDLDAVASLLNASTSGEDIFGSGELRRDGSGYRIIYATDLSLPRRRFTIAHELAHIVIDRTGPNAPRAGKELERLCDLIAVEILLPAEAFVAQLPKPLRIADIFALARQYQASISATALRCAELSRATVFEVANGKLTWSRGPLRGSSALKDNTLMEHAKRASAGESSHALLYLNDDSSMLPTQVEYHAFGQTGRALFLLTPAKASDVKAALRGLDART